jgi:hypothetical protein
VKNLACPNADFSYSPSIISWNNFLGEFQQTTKKYFTSKRESSEKLEALKGEHHHLQGLGVLACSNFPVMRIDPSVSSVVDPYFFFL